MINCPRSCVRVLVFMLQGEELTKDDKMATFMRTCACLHVAGLVTRQRLVTSPRMMTFPSHKKVTLNQL